MLTHAGASWHVLVRWPPPAAYLRDLDCDNYGNYMRFHLIVDEFHRLVMIAYDFVVMGHPDPLRIGLSPNVSQKLIQIVSPILLNTWISTFRSPFVSVRQLFWEDARICQHTMAYAGICHDNMQQHMSALLAYVGIFCHMLAYVVVGEHMLTDDTTSLHMSAY